VGAVQRGLRSRDVGYGRVVGRLLFAAPVILLSVFFLVPLLMTFMWSLWRPTDFWMDPAVDVGSYRAFFSGPRLGILRDSFVVAAGVTIVSLLVAYPIAYLIALKTKPWQTRLVLVLFAFPFLVNYIIRNVSWVYLLGREGPVNRFLATVGLVNEPLTWLLYSDFAVWLGLFVSYMPLMVFPLWVSIAGIDRRMIEASWVLGGRPAVTFLRVILPLSMPGVFAAIILAFVSTFGESAVSTILGGSGYQLIGNSITSSLNALNYPLAAAISSVVVVTMVVLLALWFRVFRAESLLGRIARWGGG
jgi:ABC-type spermidine/putrescine transport system permease subunit I